MNHQQIDQIAARIRRRVFEHVMKHDGGYLSQALSSAGIFACLYGDAMNLEPMSAPLDPQPFEGVPASTNHGYESGDRFNGEHRPDRDRFFFSPAHYALVLYAALIEVGRLAPDALDSFNVDGSTLEMIGAEHSPGIATTTGSLAQALSQANGVTLARKLRGETGSNWVFMSDGEFQEGQTWEALAFAAYHRLDRLCIVVDANGQQCDGAMTSVMAIEPLLPRLEAFGWDAYEVDGHDTPALLSALASGRDSDRPSAVIARTDPAYLVEPLAARAPLLHYLRFSSDDERHVFADAYQRLLETV